MVIFMMGEKNTSISCKHFTKTMTHPPYHTHCHFPLSFPFWIETLLMDLLCDLFECNWGRSEVAEITTQKAWLTLATLKGRKLPKYPNHSTGGKLKKRKRKFKGKQSFWKVLAQKWGSVLLTTEQSGGEVLGPLLQKKRRDWAPFFCTPGPAPHQQHLQETTWLLPNAAPSLPTEARAKQNPKPTSNNDPAYKKGWDMQKMFIIKILSRQKAF